MYVCIYIYIYSICIIYIYIYVYIYMDHQKDTTTSARADGLRGWRNTSGSLIEIVRLKQAYHRPHVTYICVKHGGVHIHRIRDFKRYYFNCIPPTSHGQRPEDGSQLRSAPSETRACCATHAGDLEVLPIGSNFKIHPRGVQWKQGVVIDMMLYASLL